jgi:hypothetical protein
VATKVKTTIAKLAPEEFEEIVDRARDSRRVSCYPEADGMATVVAILPAEDAQTVMKSIEAFILKRNQEEECCRCSGQVGLLTVQPQVQAIVFSTTLKAHQSGPCFLQI